MLVSSDRVVMQLLLPPGMSLLLFWMGRNALTSTSRDKILSENRRRLLWSVTFALLTFLYAVTFNRELRDNQLIAAGLVVLLSAFVFWRVSIWRAATNDSAR